MLLFLNVVILITDILPWLGGTAIPFLVIGAEILIVLALLLDHIMKSLSDAFTIELGTLEVFVIGRSKKKSNSMEEYAEDTLKITGT